MKIARFVDGDEIRYGAVQGDQIRVIEGDPFGEYQISDSVLALDSVQLLAPVAPAKVVCVGLNFADHASEIAQQVPQEPLFFFKPSSAIVADGETISLPNQSNQVEIEAELAMVVGKRAKGVSTDQAADHILGFTIANDVTARDLQFSDLQWARSKAFDSFCPVGPWIETEFDFASASVQSRINGQVAQQEKLSNMIRDPYELFSYISQNLTLEPGDLILTGSPAGISKIVSGDFVECEISGIGVLSNPVS